MIKVIIHMPVFPCLLGLFSHYQLLVCPGTCGSHFAAEHVEPSPQRTAASLSYIVGDILIVNVSRV